MKQKKIISFLFTLMIMILMMASVACFAASDLVVGSNKTLTSKFNPYDNVTVKKGVTLSLATRAGEPVGLEIFKSLVLEDGAKITGDGILIFDINATFSGITLYYKMDGEYYPIPKGLKLNRIKVDADDYKPTFHFVPEKGFYVLNDEFKGSSPFDAELSERHVLVVKGKKYQLDLSGITEGVKWKSEDKSIATVSKTGLVTAKKYGRVDVVATYNGKEYRCEVEVVKKGLSFENIFLNEGDKFFLQFNGATLKSVSSSDKKVAKISKKLEITAVGAGTCTITAKDTKGKKYKCQVNVEDPSNAVFQEDAPGDVVVDIQPLES